MGLKPCSSERACHVLESEAVAEDAPLSSIASYLGHEERTAIRYYGQFSANTSLHKQHQALMNVCFRSSYEPEEEQVPDG